MTTVADVAAALPDYEIGDVLGSGGFGQVRWGVHRQLNRRVAIKELPGVLANDPGVRARFAAEARVLAGLSHPHIVPLFDYVERQGLCLLVMEELTGGSVWDRFTDQGLTLESTCALVMAVCAGLQYAHERDVLHRDIKPENLLFSGDGTLKITDFGVAKVIGGGETLATKAGEILGTPGYMAPEQAVGEALGPGADVYATGIMLYELLSGQLPFSDEGGPLAIVYRHVYEQPTPLRDVAPHVPPALSDVVMRSMARDPAHRQATAEEFGVLIGEAMAAEVGAGWLEHADVAIMAAGPITASTGHGRLSEGFDGPTSGGAPSEGRAASNQTRRIGPPPPLQAPSRPRSGRPVRPQQEGHAAAAAPDISDLSEADLTPVRDVIHLPSPPWAQLLAGLALIVLVIAIAVIGLGSATKDKPVGPGVATIAGVDASTKDPIDLDLAHPIPVHVAGAAAAAADKVQLRLLMGSMAVATSSTAPLQRVADGKTANIDAQASRYLVSGRLSAELLLEPSTGTKVPFTMKSKQPPLVTVPGILAVVAMLFLLAYAESMLRPLRRGRHLVTGLVGMILIGAGLGLLAVAFACVFGFRQPTLRTAVPCVLLGAGAGVAFALAAYRVGQRRRIRPRHRAERLREQRQAA